MPGRLDASFTMRSCTWGGAWRSVVNIDSSISDEQTSNHKFAMPSRTILKIAMPLVVHVFLIQEELS
eukprot:7045208-Pyramimonas_sp.AAC.1